MESWTAVNETSLKPPQQMLPDDPKSKEGRGEAGLMHKHHIREVTALQRRDVCATV